MTEQLPPTMAEVKNRDQPQMIVRLEDFPVPDDFIMHASARIFGFLVETAAPIMENFQSDLYHDSVKLRKAVEKCYIDRETHIWVWTLNESGTTWLPNTSYSGNRKYVFRCNIWFWNGNLYFTMKRKV